MIVNGQAVATKEVPADDKEHDLTFTVPVERSSWIALRHFPQMHTNPVSVLVGGEPIRASRKSAQWCLGTIEQLWRERGFSKANCLGAGEYLIILDEDGQLALAKPTPEKLNVVSKTNILEKVTWTVPTLVGTTLYVRDKKNIVALDLGA